MKAGEKIRILRLHNNWTQGALAHLLGVSETTIRNYESGKGGIRPRHLDKLAELFQIDKAVLTGDDLNTYCDVMQVLFKLRDEFGLKIAGKDQIPGFANVVLYFDNQTIQSSVQSWHEKQVALSEAGESIDALSAWEFMFPKALADETSTRIRAQRKRGTITEEDLKE